MKYLQCCAGSKGLRTHQLWSVPKSSVSPFCTGTGSGNALSLVSGPTLPAAVEVFQNIWESWLEMPLKMILPDVFSQPSWYRILNNWPGLFSFELFSFFSPWLCWWKCQMNCSSCDSAFLSCCFLAFLYTPSFSTMQNCIPASWKGMFAHSVPSLCVIQWLDASKDNFTQQYGNVKGVFLLPVTQSTCTIQKDALNLFLY